MGYNGRLKCGAVFTVVTVLIAIYYKNTEQILQRRYRLIHALESLEKEYGITSRPKVAIGYGVCTDVSVNALQLLKYSNEIGQPEHFDKITTELELLKSFAYFFQHGAAAERYMANQTLFDELVAKARSFPSSKSTIGGNAATMAMRFAKEGCDVLLAAKLTKSLHRMMPRIKIVGGEIHRDDVHLIIEYKRGDSWGPYFSARANRYIIHNDENNPKISSLDELDKFLSTYEPDLLVISGLQMMDNYPFQNGQRRELLSKVKKQIQQVSPNATKIHFEMGSFTDERLFKELWDTIVPYVDSFGMNEQELANLHSFLYFHKMPLAVDSTPRVETVLDQIRELFIFISTYNDKHVPLTRIHVHSLAYQIILTVKDSVWKNSMAAAAKASLTAYRHVCATSHIDVDKIALILDDNFMTSTTNGVNVAWDTNKPVSCWDETVTAINQNFDIQLCVAPGLVCTEAAQTAGGGDNISSAGLVLQI